MSVKYEMNGIKYSFAKGDIFEGVSYVDMINHTLGTTYQGYQRASVLLKKKGLAGYMAWFVFINEETHGYAHWAWQNTITKDGTITETCVKDTTDKFKNDTTRYPKYRLVFQRDPNNDGSVYKCKFLGICERISVDNEEKSRTHKLIKDSIEWSGKYEQK